MTEIFSVYNFLVSIYSLLGLIALSLSVFFVTQQFPTFKEAHKANLIANKKMKEKSFYSPTVRNGILGSGIGYLVNYSLILPLTISVEFVSIWNVIFSVFIILMVYDFFLLSDASLSFSWRYPFFQNCPCRPSPNEKPEPRGLLIPSLA